MTENEELRELLAITQKENERLRAENKKLQKKLNRNNKILRMLKENLTFIKKVLF